MDKTLMEKVAELVEDLKERRLAVYGRTAFRSGLENIYKTSFYGENFNIHFSNRGTLNEITRTLQLNNTVFDLEWSGMDEYRLRVRFCEQCDHKEQLDALEMVLLDVMNDE